MKDSLILNQDNGQLRSPTARALGKSWTSDQKHPPQKGGDGGSQKTPLSLAGNTWGEKIPKCLLLRVIKHEKPWKLRSMFTPPKKKMCKITMFERGYIYKCLFLKCHVSFRESTIWVKSNALWTLHPTANEKQQNWHLCYILILPLKNNMSPENRWLEDVISYWNRPLFKGHGNFRGAILEHHVEVFNLESLVMSSCFLF